MLTLVLACFAAGLGYGPLPARVARRVFADEAPPLLSRADLRPEWPWSWLRSDLMVGGLTGLVLFTATPVVLGTRWVVPAYLWFAGVTLALTLTDLDRKLIPNRILFPSLGVGAVLLGIGSVADGDAGDLLRAALGAAAYFAALLVVAVAARGGFGMGDVKLAIMLGAFLAYESWEVLFVGGIGAFLLGGAVSILLLALRIKGRKDAMPFGPYLVVAAYIALGVGVEIADWYRG